jgi:hypothetical protein
MINLECLMSADISFRALFQLDRDPRALILIEDETAGGQIYPFLENPVISTSWFLDTISASVSARLRQLLLTSAHRIKTLSAPVFVMDKD